VPACFGARAVPGGIAHKAFPMAKRQALKPQPAGAPAPKYDVAISFLARDEQVARAFADKLGEGLSVFFFPRKQEELAGTNGLVSMREPFLDARVVAILYREPWGQTEWTRVEETAITDRCLKRGWASLVFVQLDDTSAVPQWLPHTHIRFKLKAYGIEEAVGAIKLRVQEHGGVIEPPNALARAVRVRREGEFLTERQRLFGDGAFIAHVHASIRHAVSAAVDLVREGGKDMRPMIYAGAEDRHCVMTDERVSVAAFWKQDIFNSVGRDAALIVREFRGAVAVPGTGRQYIFRPEVHQEHKFTVEVTAAFELVWKADGSRELLSTDALAHKIAMIFFDLIGKANRGEIEMPFI
jgi:hypothetical protein